MFVVCVSLAGQEDRDFVLFVMDLPAPRTVADAQLKGQDSSVGWARWGVRGGLEDLLHARRCLKCIAHISLFNLYNNPVRKDFVLKRI